MLTINYYSPYQFALFRIIFGMYLILHFLLLMPHAYELSQISGIVPLSRLLPMRAFLASLSLLSILFTLGIWRRTTALLLFLASCCLADRNFFGPTLAPPYIEFILLACVFVPAGEALKLRKKPKTHRHWAMPRWIFRGAWIILAISYCISGLYRMQNPSWLILTQSFVFLKILSWCYISFELSFIILCIFEITRKWAWLIMTLIQVVILLTGIHIELTLGLLMLHLFVFDARWLKAPAFKEHPIVFFDGQCGLCDWFVNFVISEDHNRVLLFSPLQGETAKTVISHIELDKLQSVILYDNNQLYRQSDAILRTLGYLGGLWRLLELAKIFPRPLRDRIYDYIAKRRYKWFGHHEMCRIPTPDERRFFVP